uniref:Uncharacterized protein n=1 Tax=Magallana gigas TaxID=29159 RepID=A0A8W8K1B8_MAGGI
HVFFSKIKESVSLELDNNHETVDEEIFAMVTSCKHLKDFTLNAVILIPTIQQIMELQRERKIDLRTFRLTACGLSENEWTELSEIRDSYSTMIEQRALDFRFTTDLIVDFS